MASGKTKIAIVDDERDLCFLLSDMLESNGFEVRSFYTLQSAMDGLEALKPQWIVLDNDLPDGSGWEKTDDILHMLPGVNIIKISANPDSHRAHYPANVFYLIKPIDGNSIMGLINNSQAAS